MYLSSEKLSFTSRGSTAAVSPSSRRTRWVGCLSSCRRRSRSSPDFSPRRVRRTRTLVERTPHRLRRFLRTTSLRLSSSSFAAFSPPRACLPFLLSFPIAFSLVPRPPRTSRDRATRRRLSNRIGGVRNAATASVLSACGCRRLLPFRFSRGCCWTLFDALLDKTSSSSSSSSSREESFSFFIVILGAHDSDD